MGARAGLHRARRAVAHADAGSSRACAWRITGRAGSGPTSAPTRARRRTGCSLTRATKANLSPIFSLFDDPDGTATERARARHHEPTLGPGDRRRRHGQPPVADRRPGHDRRRSTTRSQDAELLIADGHHRYETARVYAEEIGGEGPHRYVLMCLVALEDPGLTVFPTHRLLRDLRPDQHETLAERDPTRLRRRAARQHRRARPRLRPAGEPRLHRRPLPPAVDAHAQGPGDRRRRPRRPRRALPAARHRGARGADPQGRPRDDRRRHRPPGRARLRARLRPGARARHRTATTTPRSSSRPPRSRRSGPSPPPARACPRSRPTSSPRSRPGCSSTRCPNSRTALQRLRSTATMRT